MHTPVSGYHITTLQHPKHLGGAALPDLFIYNAAGHLRFIRSWFSDTPLSSSEAHFACTLGITNMWPLLNILKTLTYFNDIVADMPL